MLEAWKGEVLLGNESKAGKHRRTSVLDLSFTEPLHVEAVRKAEWVESNVTNPSLGVLGLKKERDGLGEGVEAHSGTTLYKLF